MVNQIRLTVPFESQRTDLHGPCDRQLDYAALFVTAKRCWTPDQQRFNAHRQFRHESTPCALGNGRGFPFRQRLSCPSALSLLRGGRWISPAFASLSPATITIMYATATIAR